MVLDHAPGMYFHPVLYLHVGQGPGSRIFCGILSMHVTLFKQNNIAVCVLVRAYETPFIFERLRKLIHCFIFCCFIYILSHIDDI